MQANDVGHRGRCAVLLSFILFACAGKTNDSTTSVASCGSSCSVDQVTASCSSTCAKMIQSGCSKESDPNKCTQECVQFGTKPGCPKALEFLRCAETVPVTCAGKDPDFGPNCDALLNDAEKCSEGMQAVPQPVGTDGGAGGPPVPVDDPSVCPSIPRRSSGPCVGSSGSSGWDGAIGCTSACQDSAGNLWEANCNGSMCRCRYNGAEMCMCALLTLIIDNCISCCPGTN